MATSKSWLKLALPCAILVTASAAQAELFVEPVFNSVPGTGPGEGILGFYLPDFINPATGEPFAVSDAPGVVSVYPAGFPPDPVLTNDIRFYNNTDYNMTGFVLSIVGTAVEPEPFNFTVTLDPDVEAFFGDVDEDGQIGISDIFPDITVSEDGRTITFSGGLIAPGERFTDYNLAFTTDGEPFLAAFNAYFTGEPAAVPEPAIVGLLGLGVLTLAGTRRRKRA